ncbi:hypothetical protein ES754_05280 [Psychrobacter frigidicola]|uniref:Uncharacterized protein n=1 Tax=Psychrobacter frigidicola TaxID=45611 RepID=A0A5C7A4H2_9GAMM|nr:hypothetical protein [Psychrobacter frigidicola]TXD98339.1 hypothetical protein ES754_05280 [Psychrobacter frigidicola]
MLRYYFMLSTLLISTVSVVHAREVVLPKPVIIALIEERCSSPDPNPRVSPVLEYDCSDKYEDGDEDEQSMDYSLRLVPLIAQDFDRNGIRDFALVVESSGPLGGSVTTNSGIHYVLLDKKQKIIKDHEVLLYAPFSEHIVEYSIVGQRIKYEAVPNYRSHPEAYKDGVLLVPALKFEVNWINGNPTSTYYRENCRLAGIKDKPLLKLARGVTRETDIDMHDYTQVITEKAQIRDLQVTATLEGCDYSEVVFNIEPISGQTLPVLTDVLQALIPVTHHHKQLRDLLKLDQKSQIKFGEVLSLNNNWSGRIYIDRKNNSSRLRINLSQIK